MNNSFGSRRIRRATICVASLASLASLALPGGAAPAQKTVVYGPPPWPGTRIAMVLPLKLGDKWNADQATGQALLRPAEEGLLAALDATGKLGTLRPHRFSPMLVRARDDGQIKAEQFDALVNSPTLDNARTVISSLTFAQSTTLSTMATPIMLIDTRLEEVRVSGTAKLPIVQVQVSGRIYEGASPDAFRRVTVTSDGVRAGRSNFERAVSASDDAFRKLAAEFVKPLDDIALPEPIALPSPVKTGAMPSTAGNGTRPAANTSGGNANGENANGAATANGGGRVPVPAKPLPEVGARGDLPMFPQGQLPLTPGNADPERFEGMAPAPNNATPDAMTPGNNTTPDAMTNGAPDNTMVPPPVAPPMDAMPPADAAPPVDAAPPADAAPPVENTPPADAMTPAVPDAPATQEMPVEPPVVDAPVTPDAPPMPEAPPADAPAADAPAMQDAPLPAE